MKIFVEQGKDESVDEIESYSLAFANAIVQNKMLTDDELEELGMYLFIYAQHRKKHKKKINL